MRIDSELLNAFGAPIDEADAKIIADYLKKNYGMGPFSCSKVIE